MKTDIFIQQCYWYALKEANFDQRAALTRTFSELKQDGYSRKEIETALSRGKKKTRC